MSKMLELKRNHEKKKQCYLRSLRTEKQNGLESPERDRCHAEPPCFHIPIFFFNSFAGHVTPLRILLATLV